MEYRSSMMYRQVEGGWDRPETIQHQIVQNKLGVPQSEMEP